ncbi:MAG TPA: 2,3-bisphosphoglycerate-independent phosphoglycerate mutase [Flavobacteriales bacterium]|nr:2,3-bisphosphoglycerate-independent phosphoglycerate mutase [Flavobacteriales bacterium]
MSKKVVLIILDGWGIGDGSKSDAIANAITPFVDNLYDKFPHAQLLTDGENVGLPSGQMGNSEVGHLNIGAGRIVFQDLLMINNAIHDHTIELNPVLLNGIEYAKSAGKNVHIMGLLSDGGVHSSQKHLYKLCDIAKQNGLNDVFIHAFMDGRDTDPNGGLNYLRELQDYLKGSSGKISSVIGRYFAMDRDKRWERVAKAYNLLVNGVGVDTDNVLQAIRKSYSNGITDEFIEPIIVKENGNPLPRIKEGDLVICYNFRTDRCREITMALTQRDFTDFSMKKLDLHYITMTNYDDSYAGVHTIYDKENLRMTLGEVLELHDKKQIRIAETEKYPHVTFFFSGGREEAFSKEKRILIPSPKVATYDLKPEMSAPKVIAELVGELKKQEADFICLNFANVDMVGHTGDYDAIVKAVEIVDQCTKKVVETGIEQDYSVVVIADHGNADHAINPDGSPNTAHSLNPVPCIIIDDRIGKDTQLKNGILADVAPTILSLMGIEVPKEMTGKVLY